MSSENEKGLDDNKLVLLAVTDLRSRSFLHSVLVLWFSGMTWKGGTVVVVHRIVFCSTASAMSKRKGY